LKRKVNTIITKYAQLLESMENVDTVALGEAIETIAYDPYIIIEFEVFYKGDILSTTERKILFNHPDAFETSPVYPIDRFLSDGLPVLINYRNIKNINAIFDRISEDKWVFRREATSALYKIKNGQMLHNKSEWFASIRTRIEQIQDPFWRNILKASRFLLETAIMEMGVAVIMNNHILYQNALASFIQNICHFIFALNREFIPCSRILSDEVKKLRALPDEFISRFDGICRLDNEYTPERKVEIAKLIVKSLLSLDINK